MDETRCGGTLEGGEEFQELKSILIRGNSLHKIHLAFRFHTYSLKYAHMICSALNWISLPLWSTDEREDGSGRRL